MFYIWFLILLVLEIQNTNGFDQEVLWNFSRGYINKESIAVKSKLYSDEKTNVVECYIQKQFSTLSNDIGSRKGLESMYKIFDVVLILLKSCSSNI
jgi:hypothetical protein